MSSIHTNTCAQMTTSLQMTRSVRKYRATVMEWSDSLHFFSISAGARNSQLVSEVSRVKKCDWLVKTACDCHRLAVVRDYSVLSQKNILNATWHEAARKTTGQDVLETTKKKGWPLCWSCAMHGRFQKSKPCFALLESSMYCTALDSWWEQKLNRETRGKRIVYAKNTESAFRKPTSIRL